MIHRGSSGILTKRCVLAIVVLVLLPPRRCGLLVSSTGRRRWSNFNGFRNKYCSRKILQRLFTKTTQQNDTVNSVKTLVAIELRTCCDRYYEYHEQLQDEVNATSSNTKPILPFTGVHQAETDGQLIQTDLSFFDKICSCHGGITI